MLRCLYRTNLCWSCPRDVRKSIHLFSSVQLLIGLRPAVVIGQVDDGVGVAVGLADAARRDVRGVIDGSVHIVGGFRDRHVGRILSETQEIKVYLATM